MDSDNIYICHLQAYSESIKKKTLTHNSWNWNFVNEGLQYPRQAALVPARGTGTTGM
jgi:hypothetical protein